MRVRTSTIPREILSQILMRNIDPKKPDDRLKIVRLYIQSERFDDARNELERVMKDFPDLRELDKQVVGLYQLSARRLIRELEMRRDAGQHRTVETMLARFPATGVAGEILLEVRELQESYQKQVDQCKLVLEALDKHLAELSDEPTRNGLAPILTEIHNELSLNNLDRMSDFLRLKDDEKLSADQKVSLAVSGWFLGAGNGIENLVVSLTLPQVREVAIEYLQSTGQHERQDALEKLKTLEGGTPAYLAKIIANMKPLSGELPVSHEDIAGLYELRRSGLPGDEDFRYMIQLPPEYDPYRRYPCVVSLHGAGSDPLRQIEWWAGAYSPAHGSRLGQAARRGYIIIAPYWTKSYQSEYEYSLREHAAVLWTLRDACRKFSIDTDRVFLSGHFMGGDAAWDIGLAHPDLWAGVIPISARADKYVARYWQNAGLLPQYFVFGELDGTLLLDNASNLDRYLARSAGQFDTTVVEYRGRGHEHFIDEIQEIYDWMSLPARKRQFLPREFEADTMRPWDNYFWWVELNNMPGRSMVAPISWPDPKARPVHVEATITPTNNIIVKSVADSVTVWLAPGIIDFSNPGSVTINGRKVSDEIVPSAEVILEDVRLRVDRQNPFWANVSR
jgi:predicted esterase